jgi:hypothetical protein
MSLSAMSVADFSNCRVVNPLVLVCFGLFHVLLTIQEFSLVQDSLMNVQSGCFAFKAKESKCVKCGQALKAFSCESQCVTMIGVLRADHVR